MVSITLQVIPQKRRWLITIPETAPRTGSVARFFRDRIRISRDGTQVIERIFAPDVGHAANRVPARRRAFCQMDCEPGQIGQGLDGHAEGDDGPA